jgi:hypothetical protein
VSVIDADQFASLNPPPPRKSRRSWDGLQLLCSYHEAVETLPDTTDKAVPKPVSVLCNTRSNKVFSPDDVSDWIALDDEMSDDFEIRPRKRLKKGVRTPDQEEPCTTAKSSFNHTGRNQCYRCLLYLSEGTSMYVFQICFACILFHSYYVQLQCLLP